MHCKAYLLARNRKESTDILSKDLNITQVGIVPIVFGDTQKVHECIVLGVRETKTNRYADFIRLPRLLSTNKARNVMPIVGSSHLIDTLFLKVIGLLIGQRPCQVVQVKDSLRQ